MAKDATPGSFDFTSLRLSRGAAQDDRGEKSSFPRHAIPNAKREGPAPLPHCGSPEDQWGRFLACGSEQHVVWFCSANHIAKIVPFNPVILSEASAESKDPFG